MPSARTRGRPGEQPEIGGQLPALPEEDVAGGKVGVVHLLVGAVLLHHKDGGSQPVDLEQLPDGELVKGLFHNLHAAPGPLSP